MGGSFEGPCPNELLRKVSKTGGTQQGEGRLRFMTCALYLDPFKLKNLPLMLSVVSQKQLSLFLNLVAWKVDTKSLVF